MSQDMLSILLSSVSKTAAYTIIYETRGKLTE